jgi:hypothetical protein
VEGFEWAENNLGLGTPADLQASGVNVHFAPNIRADTKAVNRAMAGSINSGRASNGRNGATMRTSRASPATAASVGSPSPRRTAR